MRRPPELRSRYALSDFRRIGLSAQPFSTRDRYEDAQVGDHTAETHAELATMDHGHAERRRHPRIPLGVPVRLRWGGDSPAMTIELVEVSLGGGSFRTPAGRPDIGQRAAFGFVVPDRSICLARGTVVRVEEHGFAIAFERMNGAFRGFLGDVSGPAIRAA
jgi:hypothetical protein